MCILKAISIQLPQRAHIYQQNNLFLICIISDGFFCSYTFVCGQAIIQIWLLYSNNPHQDNNMSLKGFLNCFGKYQNRRKSVYKVSLMKEMKSSRTPGPGKGAVPLRQPFSIYFYFSRIKMRPMHRTTEFFSHQKKGKKEIQHFWGQTEFRLFQIAFLDKY